MKQIWSKFFWSDWANDPALRVCSLAAQGLWMRMLCIMAQHDPPGRLAINGRPLTASELARAASCTEPEAENLVADLERAGVFSRDRSKCIISRRMIRDVAISKKRAKAGYIGALITHGKPLPTDKLPQQTSGNGAGKPLVKPRAINQKNNPDRAEPDPAPPPGKPLPEPGAKSALDVVERLRAAMTERKQRQALAPAERKSRWEQKIFAYVRTKLTDREYQLLIQGYLANDAQARHDIERYDLERKAEEAEREYRSQTA